MRRLTLSLALLLSAAPLYGQAGRPSVLNRGFDATAPAIATAEELAQGDLWVMQVDFKPMRLVRVETTDAKTGERREETIWYLVYRAVNRPLKSASQGDEKTPVNNYDPPPGPPLLVPEFTLVTDDNDVQQIYPDVVIPEALDAITRRELRGGDRQNVLKNSVEIVQPVPETGDTAARPIYGVATWRGIDPTTDNFKVYVSGFSNGYKEMKGPGGEPLILRREIVLDFWRPGDEFDLTEREFQVRAEPRWVYRAEDAEPTDPGQDVIPTEEVKATDE